MLDTFALGRLLQLRRRRTFPVNVVEGRVCLIGQILLAPTSTAKIYGSLVSVVAVPSRRSVQLRAHTAGMEALR
jgi:hypothetical protein